MNGNDLWETVDTFRTRRRRGTEMPDVADEANDRIHGIGRVDKPQASPNGILVGPGFRASFH